MTPEELLSETALKLKDAEAELAAVRKALEETHDTHGFVQECSKCNTQVLPDG